MFKGMHARMVWLLCYVDYCVQYSYGAIFSIMMVIDRVAIKQHGNFMLKGSCCFPETTLFSKIKLLSVVENKKIFENTNIFENNIVS